MPRCPLDLVVWMCCCLYVDPWNELFTPFYLFMPFKFKLNGCVLIVGIGCLSVVGAPNCSFPDFIFKLSSNFVAL